MSKYKYSETEQQINDVLKYHDEELKRIKASMPSSSELDSRIQESEDLLRMLGYAEMPTVPKREEPKKVMVVPLWEELCIEAEQTVGSGHALESIFTEAELQRNSQEIQMLNAEYNQLHRLDKYDVAISAAAGMLGHDPLLGLIFGVADILTGRMTTIDKTGKIVSQIMENYVDRKETDVFAAIAKQIIHSNFAHRF